VTLSLTSDAGAGQSDATPEAGDCAGVVEWANSSAERLDAAQGLLDSLATLADDPAVAVPDLRDLSSDLESLADEQRSVEAPREIATANYYIIGAITDFAAAIALAADGLERGDQATVDEAVDDLDAADARAVRASRRSRPPSPPATSPPPPRGHAAKHSVGVEPRRPSRHHVGARFIAPTPSPRHGTSQRRRPSPMVDRTARAAAMDLAHFEDSPSTTPYVTRVARTISRSL
jgi:hypothetical protein